MDGKRDFRVGDWVTLRNNRKLIGRVTSTSISYTVLWEGRKIDDWYPGTYMLMPLSQEQIIDRILNKYDEV